MSRPARIGFAGAVHHVMARGDRREEIFRDDRDGGKFLGYLAEGAERYRVKVNCYVLMENHFHLLVMTPEGNLSQWMHQLKTAYTVYFNLRHQVVGHLFQGRFKSTVIEAEKYFAGGEPLSVGARFYPAGKILERRLNNNKLTVEGDFYVRRLKPYQIYSAAILSTPTFSRTFEHFRPIPKAKS